MDINIMEINNKKLSLIKDSIKFVPNYPTSGILFRDITTLLENPCIYSDTIMLLAQHYKCCKFNKIVGIEARGFLFGAPLALTLKLGFIPARKLGKLPRKTIQEPYILEYGSGCLEIHSDAIVSGDRVLIVDDLLATGSTLAATVRLIRRLGGNVEDAAFIIDLEYLGGKFLLRNIGINVYSLIVFSK